MRVEVGRLFRQGRAVRGDGRVARPQSAVRVMKRHSPFSLGQTLIGLALRGWTEAPGYTVCERESTGEVYIAIQLSPPRTVITRADVRS